MMDHPEVEAFARNLLKERLALCTEAQQELFGRLYSKGVPTEKLSNAIDICDRTIKKNLAKRATGEGERG